MVKVEKLPIKPMALGEAPHWEEDTQTLVFIDIVDGTASKYDPATKTCNTVDLGFKPVSFIIPVEGKKGQYIVGTGMEVKKITWDGKSSELSGVETLFKANPGDQETRINDGKCDARGRLWTGSMGPYLPEEKTFILNKGALYSYEAGRGLKQHVKGVGLSNGLGWSQDGKQFYYIDSLTHQVAAYDYDIESGTLGKMRVVFDLKANNLSGLPDGMAVDADGKLWVATYEGAKVLRIDPETGNLLQTVDLPSYQTTAVAFGGKDLDELYVTSAKADNLSDEIKKKYPDCGCTFKVTGLGVRGLPAYRFRE